MILLLIIFTLPVIKQSSDVRVLNSSVKGVEFIYTPTTLDLNTPPYIFGATIQPEAGKPELPVKYVTIGIPVGANIDLEASALETEEVMGKEVLPARGIIDKGKDTKVYSMDALWPSEAVSIEERGIYRGQEIIKLRINPVRYNPVSQLITAARSLKVKVTFSGGGGIYSSDNLFEGLFKSILLNYEQARNWRVEKDNKKSRKYSTGPWYKLKIPSEGIYKISNIELNFLGIEDVNPTTFKIYNGGSKMHTAGTDSLMEIPIYVLPDTSIIFYASGLGGWGNNDALFLNPYTDTNVYWLTYGGEAGKRDSIYYSGSASTPSYFIDTLHIEQDNECPAKSGLMWIWERIERPSNSETVKKSYTFNVSSCYNDSYKLKLSIYGWYTDRSDERKLSAEMVHNIRGYLNNAECLETSWIGGEDDSSRIFEVSGKGLKEGINTFTIELFKGSSTTKDIVFFNWFEVEYLKDYNAVNGEIKFKGAGNFEVKNFNNSPTVFDITDRINPVRIYGTSFSDGELSFYGKNGFYFASCKYKTISNINQESPYNLRNKFISIKNIIITPPDFVDYANRLRDYRVLYGTPTEVVLTTEIYNNFSFGLANSPDAIKNFLSFAYENWGKPGYCLLLGAGTFAYKLEVSKNRVPPWEEGYKVGEYGYPPQDNHCWDNWYADNNIAIGRVSAKTTAEARDAVDKIIKYESSPGAWRNRILLVSDDEDPDGNLFINNIKKCFSMIPNEFDIFTVYSMNYPLESSKKPTARNDLIRYIDKGMFISLFSGHGNLYLIGHEVLFYNPQDIEALNNSIMNPISQFWSCGVGCFDRIDDNSMADYMQKIYNKGSIATVASARTTGGSSGMDTLLVNLLLKNKVNTIGQAMFGRGLAFPLQVNENLFADPATRVPERIISVEIDSFSTVISGGKRCVVKGTAPGAKLAHITVRSSEYDNTYVYRWYPNTSGSATYKMRGRMIDYQLCEDILFEGTTEVKDGKWEQEFFIPVLDSATDEILCGDKGKISVFAWDGNLCGSTSKEISVTWGTGGVQDVEGPQITLFANGNLMKSKTIVPSSFTLSAIIADESGINTFNKIKPLNLAMTLVIKRGSIQPLSIQLADYFQYDIGSCTRGKLSYFLELDEDDKEDTLELQVSDNAGNRKVAVGILHIESAKELAISRVLNFPNPVRGEHTNFNFFLSKPAKVGIKIYTVSGRLIKVISPGSYFSEGGNKIYWDTRDKLGNRVGNGIYLYKITASSDAATQEEDSQVSKLMILR